MRTAEERSRLTGDGAKRRRRRRRGKGMSSFVPLPLVPMEKERKKEKDDFFRFFHSRSSAAEGRRKALPPFSRRGVPVRGEGRRKEGKGGGAPHIKFSTSGKGGVSKKNGGKGKEGRDGDFLPPFSPMMALISPLPSPPDEVWPGWEEGRGEGGAPGGENGI